MPLRRSFDSFTPHFRKKYTDLFQVKYTLKGALNPEQKARSHIRKMGLKTTKQWRADYYRCMLSIDRKRKAAGLKPIYFEDEV